MRLEAISILESGDEIISYSFSTRDIAQIDGFCDMVNSASADTSSVSISKFISLEEAKKIALKDADLMKPRQKIVFTREELNRNSGKPLLHLEVLHGQVCVFPKVDAVSGDIIGKKTDWFSRQESELVPKCLKIPIPSSAGETNQT